MAFTHQLFLWPSGDPNLGCLASYRLALRSENSMSRRGMDIPNVVTTSWTWGKTHHYEKYINLSLIFTIYIYVYAQVHRKVECPAFHHLKTKKSCGNQATQFVLHSFYVFFSNFITFENILGPFMALVLHVGSPDSFFFFPFLFLLLISNVRGGRAAWIMLLLFSLW